MSPTIPQKKKTVGKVDSGGKKSGAWFIILLITYFNSDFKVIIFCTQLAEIKEENTFSSNGLVGDFFEAHSGMKMLLINHPKQNHWVFFLLVEVMMLLCFSPSENQPE